MERHNVVRHHKPVIFSTYKFSTIIFTIWCSGFGGQTQRENITTTIVAVLNVWRRFLSRPTCAPQLRSLFYLSLSLSLSLSLFLSLSLAHTHFHFLSHSSWSCNKGEREKERKRWKDSVLRMMFSVAMNGNESAHILQNTPYCAP